jgi:GTP-binding protein
MRPEPPPAIVSASYLVEARTLASLPPAGPPEVAIAGRSNVGKSTLLNRLAARPALARTSRTPGRTRGLLFYELAVRWSTPATAPEAGADPGAGRGPAVLRFVDFPGYGYAQVSKAERAGWRRLVEGYARSRPGLVLFLTLVDARRGLEDEERQLVDWLAHLGVRQQLVATKIDKLGASERGVVAARLRAAVGPAAPPPVAVSGQTGEGVGGLWSIVRRAIDEARPSTAPPGLVS